MPILDGMDAIPAMLERPAARVVALSGSGRRPHGAGGARPGRPRLRGEERRRPGASATRCARPPPDGFVAPSAALPARGRFSPNARTPSRRSSESKLASRSSMSSRSTSASSSPSAASSSRITRLLPRTLSGALAARSSAPRSSASLSSSAAPTTSLTSPQSSAVRASTLRAEQEQLARARRADGLEEAPQPGVGVDEPELGRRHAERIPSAATRRSQASASSRPPPMVWPGSAATVGHLAGLERLERRGEGVGDEALGLARRRRRRGCRRCRSPRRTSRRRR